jgi:hypothetical protein
VFLLCVVIILTVLDSTLSYRSLINPFLDRTLRGHHGIDLLVVVVYGVEAARRHFAEAQLMVLGSVLPLIIRGIIYHRACRPLSATTQPELVGHRDTAGSAFIAMSLGNALPPVN